jgi:serine/threonine-protein kinase
MDERVTRNSDRKAARQVVRRFEMRFDPSYRLLACHATLPLVLTPELVNYLRTEFLLDRVDWVAESDLLLSDLCREVGYETYAMDPEVRAYLIEEMRNDPALGEKRLRDVALRVFQYVNTLAVSDLRLDPEDVRGQRWEAMVYLDEHRDRAVREIVDALQYSTAIAEQAGGFQRAGINWAELSRLSYIIEGMGAQLENHFGQLVEYARVTKRITDVRAGFASEAELASEQLSRDFDVLNRKLTPLSNLIGQLESERVKSSKKVEASEPSQSQLVTGEVRTGTVESIKLLHVVINFAPDGKAIAPLTEFLSEGMLTVEPGDEVDMIVTRQAQSHYPALAARADATRVETLEDVKEAYRISSSIIGRVIEYTEISRSIVEIAGLRAFMPISEFDIRRIKRAHARRLLNHEIGVQIKSIDSSDASKTPLLSVSRAAALKKAEDNRRKRTLDNLEVGHVTEGRITKLNKQTAILDISGITALLRADDMSWAKSRQPKKLFKIGEIIAVKVLELDHRHRRFVVDRKQLLPDPWATVEQRFPAGIRVKGVMTASVHEGISIELEPGVDGYIDLVAQSNEVWPLPKAGELVEVEVLAADVTKRLVSLRLPLSSPTLVMKAFTPPSEFATLTVSKQQEIDKDQKPKEEEITGVLPPGTLLLDRYLIVGLVRRGGVSATYQGRDKRLGDRLCSIKELIASSGEKVIDDFRRGAENLSHLEHPSIPLLYDYFIERGRYYVVMKWSGATDLYEQLRLYGGIIDEATVTRWAIQICDALHHMHTRLPPVVYRNLKPSNLILDDNTGRVVLGDFGLSVAVRPTDRNVSSSGTPGYAPPELFAGRIDPRSDIYSLGAIMFHLLTGADPQDNPLHIFDFSKNPRPRQINPSITAEMEQIIMKAVAHRPDDRHSSALEMMRLLEDHAHNLSTSQSPSSPSAAPSTLADSSWKSCTHCGSSIRLYEVYCVHCGARQPSPSSGSDMTWKEGQPVARLVMIEKPETGKTYEIKKDSVVIGRIDPYTGIFPEIDLTDVDPETKVSRRHARIYWKGQKFLIEDLGSVNGTILTSNKGGAIRLNPQSPRQITAGDMIRIAALTFRFEV